MASLKADHNAGPIMTRVPGCSLEPLPQLWLLSILLAAFGVLGSCIFCIEAWAQDSPNVGRMGESIQVPADEARFSEAEALLWQEDHLRNLPDRQRLHYSFKKSGTLEEGFEDSVKLEVRVLHGDGTKTVGVDFFTGQRQQAVQFMQNVDRVRGNPVLGFYLQGEVYEMQRRTEGSWRHFQQRLKRSFADSAEVHDISIEYEGESMEARKITVRPYLDDPRRVQYAELAYKTYELIFSEKIPGMLYRISSVLPAREEGIEHQIEEVLTFTGAEKI